MVRNQTVQESAQARLKLNIEGATFVLSVVLPSNKHEVSTGGATDRQGKSVGGLANAPPIGDYGVYQHTGTLGYEFLYRLRFLNEREYTAYEGTRGRYTMIRRRASSLLLPGR